MKKTLIILISHQSEVEITEMYKAWQRTNPLATIVVAYGGNKTSLNLPTVYKVVQVKDARLKTRDHPREKQSYLGVMREILNTTAELEWTRVLLVEYDVVPLSGEICVYLEDRREKEKADVLGVGLRRLDGTGHAHYLTLLNDKFFSEWLSKSRRTVKETVFMMIGCLSWWTREAFETTARHQEMLPLYLEIALPTTPHQLGFRVRNVTEFEEFIQVSGDFSEELEIIKKRGGKLAHPCKTHWAAESRKAQKLKF